MYCLDFLLREILLQDFFCAILAFWLGAELPGNPSVFIRIRALYLDKNMECIVRKYVTTLEECTMEMGKVLDPSIRRAVAMVVLENPYSGSYSEDLQVLIDFSEVAGKVLTENCLKALNATPDQIESFGKGAIVGADGELEHGAALLHPRLGVAMRAVLGGGKALVPSAKKRAGVGATIDVPLGHINAAAVRSHFDAIEARVTDAPRANEIVIAVALTVSGRPLPRIGGLQVSEIKGEDGIR